MSCIENDRRINGLNLIEQGDPEDEAKGSGYQGKGMQSQITRRESVNRLYLMLTVTQQFAKRYEIDERLRDSVPVSRRVAPTASLSRHLCRQWRATRHPGHPTNICAENNGAKLIKAPGITIVDTNRRFSPEQKQFLSRGHLG